MFVDQNDIVTELKKDTRRCRMPVLRKTSRRIMVSGTSLVFETASYIFSKISG